MSVSLLHKSIHTHQLGIFGQNSSVHIRNSDIYMLSSLLKNTTEAHSSKCVASVSKHECRKAERVWDDYLQLADDWKKRGTSFWGKTGRERHCRRLRFPLSIAFLQRYTLREIYNSVVLVAPDAFHTQSLILPSGQNSFNLRN